jgi:hypothetical protein
MMQFDSEPARSNETESLYPQDCPNHLLMVWFTGYIEHSPTRYTVAGKKSDAIVVDIVDLDQADENGYQGKVFRQTWWRPGRLIGFGKQRIGRPNPVLARMVKGAMIMGNYPYELELMDHDPECVNRGKAWFQANPGWKPTGAVGNRDVEVDTTPTPAPVQREMSQLERLAASRVGGPATQTEHQNVLRQATGRPPLTETRTPPPPPLPPARPGSDIPDNQIPF